MHLRTDLVQGENRKSLFKNKKLTTRLQNKTWTNSQIKNQTDMNSHWSDNSDDTKIQNTSIYILNQKHHLWWKLWISIGSSKFI